MAATANDLLKEILGVVSKIERNMENQASSQKKGGSKIGISSSLGSLSGSKAKGNDVETFLKFSEKIVEISNKTKDPTSVKNLADSISIISRSIPDLAEGLNSLSGIKAKALQQSLFVMDSFLETLTKYGDSGSQRNIRNTINTFNELAQSSRDIRQMFNSFSVAMVSIAGSMVIFAGGLALMGNIFGVPPAMAALSFSTSLLLILGSFYLLGTMGRTAKEGIATARNMGMATGILSVSLLAFSTSLNLMGRMFGTNALQGVLMYTGIMTLLTGTFVLLGMIAPLTQKGAATARNMAVSMAILSVGLVTFATSINIIGSILGSSFGNGKDFEAMGMSIPSFIGGIGLAMGLILLMTGVFVLMGTADKFIKQGATSVLIMGLTMAVLSTGLLMFTGVAYAIQGLKDPGETMLIVGAFIAGIVGIYAVLGAAGPVIATGAGVILLMAGSLFALSTTIKYAVHTVEDVIKSIQRLETLVPTGQSTYDYVTTSLTGTISSLLVGTTKGILYGLTGTMPGENVRPRDLLKAYGNVAILMTGLGILRSTAKTVSKFIEAISAFADIGNMRIIESFKPDGTPVFGKTVDVRQVTTNMTDTFAYFLSELISSTEGLTRKHARAIKKMGRALTGRRGILSSVIQFTDALQVYAQYGPQGMIGYTFFEEVGTDADGNPKYVEKRGKVGIDVVTQNIVNSYGMFIEGLVNQFDGTFFTPATKRKLKRMGRALTGKNGVMQSVIQFSEALSSYAEFGASNEVGYMTYDESGKEIRKSVKVKTVIDNMLGTFIYFTKLLFDKSESEFGDGEPGFSGRQKRRLKRMSKALTGKHGILGSVIKFSETLKTFSEFGENNEIPIFDADGKMTNTISVKKIADNIVTTLTTFSDTLADQLDKGKTKDAKRSIRKYESMIESLSSLSKATDGLSRVNVAITDLANGIGLLGDNLSRLDTDKLNKAAISAEKYNVSLKEAGVPTTYQREEQPVATRTIKPSTSPTPQYKEPNWDNIAAKIGADVGAQVAEALKGGHFVFEFDMSKTGGSYYWSPR